MFKVGDVVVLKSGGPRMTVESVANEVAHCVWFEKTKKHEGNFNVALLASGLGRAISV